MAAKRRARRPIFDSSKGLGRDGGNEGSDDDNEESSESGEEAIPAEPKKMPLKRAEERSPPEDAGAQVFGEASPTRSSPRGGVAMKTKTTSSARGPLPDAGHNNKRAATPMRGQKRSPPPPQEEERPEKRAAAGPDAEAVAASSPQRKKKSKRAAEKQRRKNKKKKEMKQLKRAMTKPKSPPQLLSDIAQEDERNGREMAEQEHAVDTSPPPPPQDEHKTAEQEHAGGGDTSPPHDKDMHSAPHGEEKQEGDAANQDHVDDHSADEGEQQGEGVPQQERPKEDQETGAQVVNGKVLQGRNAPSTRLRSSETEKKPAVERLWSYDDELKILKALAEHAQSRDGALPDSSYLLANLTFDKIDANEDKLTDKIRKLRTRYRRWLLSQGCPSDNLSRRLFKLSEIIWGQVDEDEQVEPTSSRDFSVLSKLYPHLAKQVKAYSETQSSGDLIMAMFMTIGDEKARDLDAKCKKQQIEAFKLELGQASLTNELLSALSSLTL